MAKHILLPQKITTSQSAQLAFIAGLSGLIYLLVFTLPFPLPTLYNTIPPVDYTKLTGYSRSGFITYVAGLGALFGLYLWAVKLTWPGEAKHKGGEAEEQRTRSGRTGEELVPGYGGQRPALSLPHGSAVGGRFILNISAILAVILLFSYPVTAIDLFIYAIRTRGWVLYGFSPLATPPQALPAADPWLGLAAEWRDAPSPYGPLWEGVSLAAFYLSEGDFLSHLFALKLVTILAYLGCAWLVYQILQQLQPRWAAAGTIAFAWSPLVLLESAQNGHNDIVMVFFLLAAMWTLAETTRRERTASQPSISYSLLLTPYSSLLPCLFLALSILVKFITILLVPFFLLALTTRITTWPKRLALMVGYGLTISTLVLLPMWPLWPGWDKWAVLQVGSGAGRSLLALLVLSLKDTWGVNFAFDFSQTLLFFFYGLIYLFCLWRMVSSQKSVVSSQMVEMREPTFQPFNLPTLLTPSFHALFWYVLLVAPVFHAWYLLWFVPLAALLLPRQRPLNAATLFSVMALLIIPYFETIRVWYPVLLENPFLGHVIGVPLLLVPPALALLWPISPSTKFEV